MKSVRTLAGVLAFTMAACTIPEPRSPSPTLRLPDKLKVRTGGRVVSVPIEEYVLGSALAEVTPLNEADAVVARIYEVQSVIARSYAARHVGRHGAEGFDLCDSTHCQLYEPGRIKTSRFSAAARAAVDRTAGQVLRYGGQAVESLFHADCGGATTSAEDVWGGRPLPYLVPTKDEVPSLQHRAWQYTTTGEALRAALNRDTRSAVGTRLTAVDVVSRDLSGRATSVSIRGQTARVVRGETLRAILNRSLGDRAIQSTRFTLTRKGPEYLFAGSGFGHGVGLCQAGAAARARRGDSLSQILSAYFSDAKLAKLPH